MRRLIEQCDARVAELDAQIAEAEPEERRSFKDPEVLVRRSDGAVRSVYHKAVGACGKTKQGGDFMTMRESQARERYHGALKEVPVLLEALTSRPTYSSGGSVNFRGAARRPWSRQDNGPSRGTARRRREQLWGGTRQAQPPGTAHGQQATARAGRAVPATSTTPAHSPWQPHDHGASSVALLPQAPVRQLAHPISANPAGKCRGPAAGSAGRARRRPG
jgi:hypothetical protein